jgi:polyisoprenoid-binding protein YceI
MTPWKLDPTHSTIQFSVRHLMVSNVRGSFRDFDLELVFDPEHPELGSVVATIATKSIDTGQPQRDAHLCSADFLDAEQYPALLFRSTGVTARGGDAFELRGDLTMHGVTKPVVLEAEYVGEVANPQGGRTAGISAHGKIKRHEWGLVWNVGLEAGGMMVGDEIKVELELELTQAAAVEAPAPVHAGSEAA